MVSIIFGNHIIKNVEVLDDSKSPLDNPHNCKICLEYISSLKDRFKPCYCQQPIHRQCLKEWLKYSHKKNQCEICEYRYKFQYSFKWKWGTFRRPP